VLGPLVPYTLVIWAFVLTPVLFVLLPRRTAAFTSLLGGWLLLPFTRMKLIEPFNLDKAGACGLGVLLCTAVFAPAQMARFRLSLVDIPMLLWLLSGFFASVFNDLGVRDGLASVYNTGVFWGVPYLVGRLYVTDAASLRAMAIALIVAGLAYVPLVLWEAKMSPRLHADLYGFVTYDHGGTTTRRLGGWRPVVFMQHGLMLGLLYSGVVITAAWMWFTGAWRGVLPRRGGDPGRPAAYSLPAWPVLLALAFTLVLTRALNAYAVTLLLVPALFMLRFALLPTRLVMLLVCAAPVLYVINRIVPQLPLDEMILGVVSGIDSSRAASLEFRFFSENQLSAKAMEQPVFGWGGWGRSRVYDDFTGEDVSVTDGLWIIIFGERGIFGLLTWYLALLGPVLLLLLRYPARVLGSKEAAPALALSAVLLTFVIDSLPNAMPMPIYPMITGGLASMVLAMQERQRAQSYAPGRLALAGQPG
jgi:hypothetical protein